MNDPYFLLKEELILSIELLSSTLEEYKTTFDHNKKTFLLSELKNGFYHIDIDNIKLLDIMMERIKQNRIQFSNITNEEITERENFIKSIKNQLSELQNEIERTPKPKKYDLINPYEKALQQDNEDFVNNEQHSQQTYEIKAYEGLDRIERKLDTIYDMSLTIQSQANQDIIELDRISENMEHVDNQLKSAIKKINNLIDRTSDFWIYIFIGILILIIIALIVIVLYI